MTSRFAWRMAVVSACALLWGACSKSGNKADTTATPAPDTAHAAAGPTAPFQPTLNDTTILAMLGELNSADSSAGNLASTKGTQADVKAFGKQMMTDHHKLNAQGEALAKKLKIAPNPPAVDTIPAAVQRTMDSLTAMPKGAAWDKAYVDHEVAVHQAVLNFLQQAQGAASATALKTAITQAEPLIQAHLQKAQQVEAKLSGPAVGGGSAVGRAP